jgi:hypothetical protein
MSLYIEWSPDSQWMLVTYTDSAGNTENTFIDPSGKQQFSSKSLQQGWGWTADSAYYLFSESQEIVVWERNTHQYRHTGIIGNFEQLSPTGDRFAILSPTQNGNLDLVIYTLADNTQRSFPEPYNTQSLEPTLIWSPDGQRVILATLVSQDQRGPDFTMMNLAEYNVDGSSIPFIDESANGEITQSADMGPTLVWSPDSRRIIYIRQVGSKLNLADYDFSTQHTNTLVTGTASDFQSIDDWHLSIWQGQQNGIFDLKTGALYPNSNLGDRFALSPDNHLLITNEGATLLLIKVENAKILDYSPAGSIFEHRAIWAANSQQVAVYYRTTNGYFVDIVRADGSLQKRVRLNDLAYSPSSSQQLWWSALDWTPCWKD